MKANLRLALVLLALATCCGNAQASTILGPGEQSAIAQALFADLAVTSVGLDQNPNAGYFFTYQGSTVGASWSGSLTGQFLGIISNGSLSGSIIPDSTNIDPTWTIDRGTVSIGGTPYTLSGTLGFDADLNGSVNFTAKRTTGNATTTINWTNVGNLTTTPNANPISTTFAGTLIWNQSGRQAANYEMAITIFPALGNEQARITSTINKDGKTQTVNQGKLTITKQTSFDSTESIDISSVPEPSSLMLLALSMVALVGYRRHRLGLAAKNRLPTVYSFRLYVEAGGLMSYEPNVPDMSRHAAIYVDKILKGAKPGDLPVEQPTKLELVINLKTARALGLTIPPSVLGRADELIQ